MAICCGWVITFTNDMNFAPPYYIIIKQCVFSFLVPSIRNSMSHLRPSRGGENRRSVFYTASSEDWEMVDPPGKDTPEHKPPPDSQRRESPSHFQRCKIIIQRFNLIKKHKLLNWMVNTFKTLSCHSRLSTDSIGSAFTFDFRNPSRMKRPFHVGSGKANRSAESSPVECNGTKTSELQLRIQSQQEEINRLQEQENNLREELASQKVQ